MQDDVRKEYLRQAEAYNRYLADHVLPENLWPYEKQLSIAGTDQPFATVLIPKIALTMPVYHGTDTEVLANGAGHLEGTSLPIGGKSTHAILTAHSGMRGMRAFDDIRELKSGDHFFIEVMGKKLAYKVYGKETVLPEKVKGKIEIQEGRDLCTLITCTPYGINDHRLLVHGKRCRYTEKSEKEKPSVTETAGNRRLLPMELSVAAAVLLIVPGMVRRRKRCREDKDAETKGDKS